MPLGRAHGVFHCTTIYYCLHSDLLSVWSMQVYPLPIDATMSVGVFMSLASIAKSRSVMGSGYRATISCWVRRTDLEKNVHVPSCSSLLLLCLPDAAQVS